MNPTDETLSWRQSAISKAKTDVKREQPRSISEEVTEDARTLAMHEDKLPQTRPANVKRDEDANKRAIPPPPNRTSNSRPGGSSKTERGRKKRPVDAQDNGDSDSEDDRRKQKRTDDEDAPVSRRKATVNATDIKPTISGPSRSSFLTPEEERRVQLMARLKRAVPKWIKLEQDRRASTSRRLERQQILTGKFYDRSRSWIGRDTTIREQMQESVRKESARRAKFCDKIYAKYIEEQLDQDTENGEETFSKSTSPIDNDLRNMEEEFLSQCMRHVSTDCDTSSWELLNLDDRMDSMLRSILSYLQECCKKVIAATGYDYTRHVIFIFVSAKCSGFISHAFAEERRGHIVLRYWIAVLEFLFETITGTSSRIPRMYIENGHRSWRSIFTPSEILSIQEAGIEIEDETLSRNRRDRISPRVREIFLNNFREDLNSVREREEFVENLVYPDQVCLVLFKDDILTGVHTVPNSELESIGWRRDSPTGPYWRYFEYYHEFYKVQMDGEVIGIWTADVDISWNEVSS